MPRTAVVVAHPDDETIAIGGRITRYRDARFIHVTDGAPVNGADAKAAGFPSVDAYRDARVAELRNALRAGGIEQPHLHPLEVPDQQASLRLREITCRVAAVLAELAPEAILTHPFEGGHPDHDGCAFAVHHAAEIYAKNHRHKPVIFESTFYHASQNGIEAGTFVPQPDAPQERTLTLGPDELARKRTMLDCFTSQRETLKLFPLEQERFRLAPTYDFTHPPHANGFLYDRFPWGIKSQRFLELAAAVHAELISGTSPCPEPS
jgi:LmbE family N-acetylglucosaminyl deacetylase